MWSPSARHLWEMKQVLYSQPYENPVKETPYTGFSYQRIVPVRYEITLDCPEDIRAPVPDDPLLLEDSPGGGGGPVRSEAAHHPGGL